VGEPTATIPGQLAAPAVAGGASGTGHEKTPTFSAAPLSSTGAAATPPSACSGKTT
jgi:hypothetical protein